MPDREQGQSGSLREPGLMPWRFCLSGWQQYTNSWFLASVLCVSLSFPFVAHATSYSDDFNDGTINSSLWRRFGDNIVSESGGTLKFYADDPPSVLTGGLSLKSALQENFDIMVDLKSWDLALNSSTPGLGAKKTNVGFEITGGNPFNPDYISLRREYPLSGTSDGIWGLFWRNEHESGSVTHFSENPQTGKVIEPEQFRLRKSGSDITAFYYDKRGEQKLCFFDKCAFDEDDFSRLLNNPLELRFVSQVGDMAASKVDTFTAKLDNVKIETTGRSLSLSSERPILLLPGLKETADDWKTADPSLRQYGLSRGGVLSASWPGGKLEISGSSLANRDYYLLNFSDYQGSIATQGNEVQAAVQKVKELTGAEEVVLIAHSMGGLAARSYVQSGRYADDVMELITIDTPHLGSELALLPDIKDELWRYSGWQSDNHWTGPEEYINRGEELANIDYKKKGVKDLKPGSPFLNDLNAREYPSDIDFVSVIHEFTKYEIKPGSVNRNEIDKWGFANSFLGYGDLAGDHNYSNGDIDGNIYNGGDGVVSIVSQNMNNVGIPSTKVKGRNNIWHNAAIDDFNAILAALNVPYVSFMSFSPVDLEVIDPTGAIVDKTNFGFHGIYQEFDFSDGGDLEDYVLIPYPHEGRYSVRVIPHLNADSDDTFSLAMFSNDFESFFAQDVMIRNIPGDPYTFDYGSAPPIPEPGSMALFGVGIAGLIFGNRTSRRKTRTSESYPPSV